MTSVRDIKDRCAVCNVEEKKPIASLSVCQTHFELRCRDCARKQQHATPPAPLFSNANKNESSFIEKLIQEKEIDGQTYVLVRWRDSWIPKSDIQTADASLTALADAVIDNPLTANDIGNNHCSVMIHHEASSSFIRLFYFLLKIRYRC